MDADGEDEGWWAMLVSNQRPLPCEHTRENVRLCCAPEQLVHLVDEFNRARPGWTVDNRAHVFGRAVERGLVEFHEDRRQERARGVRFDPPSPWQHRGPEWGW